MINSISSNTPVQAITSTTQRTQPAAQTTKPAEDSVHLSPQATAAAAAASKDVDHDGDSH